MRVHASAGRRPAIAMTRGLGWLAAFTLIHSVAVFSGDSGLSAQTWKVSTSVEAHDLSAELCGFTECYAQPVTNVKTDSFTLPGGVAKVLGVSTMRLENYPENGIRDCGGPGGPTGLWCQDSSHAVGSSGMAKGKWTGHHDIWAKAVQKNHGSAKAVSHAEGVITIVYPGHAGPIPAGALQLHFHANGGLHAHCGAPLLTATASLDIAITTTPFARTGGGAGMPPDIGGMAGTWKADCIAGPFDIVGVPGDMVFDLVNPLPATVEVGDKYSFTLDWTNETDAESPITDMSLADASADFPSTADWFSDTFNAPGLTIDTGVPNQAATACPLNVNYFRGFCASGAPCNADADCGVGICTVTPAVADDQTVLSWPAGLGADLYAGAIPSSGAGIWTLAAPNLTLNNEACLAADVFGDNSGPLTQTADPNPAPGTASYYQVSFNTPAGGSTTAQGCAMPAMCSNAGWCQLGATPGSPCNVNADCAGGGTCVLHRSVCSTSNGGGDQGGCAQHSACAGGANNGLLCQTSADCPGGTCPSIPPTTVSPGSVCYVGIGAGCEACPSAGSPTRLLRLVGAAVMCP